MVAISLFIELLRTRPRALFWAMVATQVVLWTLVPSLVFTAPPGNLPVTLAIGHEFQLGTQFGPPLAFWLAEIAFRLGGMFGVYLLSQACVAVTYLALLWLGRAIVGEVHAVTAVLLMAGVAAFSLLTPEFGPGVLAAPLWALILCHFWRAAQQDQWPYWLAVGLEIGLLLLTTYAGLILVLLLFGYSLSTQSGRAQYGTIGPWIAGIVAIAVLFPYLAWLDLSGGATMPNAAVIAANVHRWGQLTLTLLAGHIGLLFLVVMTRGILGRSGRPPPEILRPPVPSGARQFVYFFAIVPLVGMGLFALITRRPDNFVGLPLVVLSGLAVVMAAGDRIRIENQYVIGICWGVLLVLPPILVALAIAIQPWVVAADLQVGQPAAAMGHYFGDSFQRRTGRALAIVAGDRATASLVALMAPSRPSLYLQSDPEYLPRVSRQDIDDKGAVVVWPATDNAGRPPPEILREFPEIVAEVPESFRRRFQGRMPLMRIGWGLIRPRTAAR